MAELDYDGFDDAKVAHLNLIQGIVNRLEGNAFALKAMSITLAAVVMAFVGSTGSTNMLVSFVACLPVIMFWLMEARYIQLGRYFRSLFDAVRRGQVAEPFSMDFGPYVGHEQGIARIALSWSVCWFYLTILAALAAVAIVVQRVGSFAA